MTVQFYPGIGNQCWNKEVICARLNNIAEADKSKQWILEDLSTPQAGTVGQTFWVVAKHFNFMRRGLYGIDLNVSQAILESLSFAMIENPDMTDLFLRAINNFQKITGRTVHLPTEIFKRSVADGQSCVATPPVHQTAPQQPPVVMQEPVVVETPPVIVQEPIFVPPVFIPEPVVVREPVFIPEPVPVFIPPPRTIFSPLPRAIPAICPPHPFIPHTLFAPPVVNMGPRVIPGRGRPIHHAPRPMPAASLFSTTAPRVQPGLGRTFRPIPSCTVPPVRPMPVVTQQPVSFNNTAPIITRRPVATTITTMSSMHRGPVMSSSTCANLANRVQVGCAATRRR